MPAPLDKDQQRCVNELNKRGEMVNRKQLQENERCLRDFQREKLDDPPMTFDQCTTADRKQKVQKTEEKTEEQQAKKCDSLDAPPPFAYTSAATVNAAAVDGALALTYAIFGGPPVLDASLVTNSENRDTAKCQLEVLKRADKLETTVLKEIAKAKKKALRDEVVDSAAALEEQLRFALLSNRRIANAQYTLVKNVDRACVNLVAAPGVVFPGSCAAGNPDLGEFEDCAIAAARCVACEKINAFDDLNLDCDEADDGAANESCP